MNNGFITKPIYKLTKTESKIVCAVVKELVKIIPLPLHIKSIKAEFSNCSPRLNNDTITDLLFQSVYVETDIGKFKIHLWTELEDFEAKFLIKDEVEIDRTNHKPILKYYHKCYPVSSDTEEYVFTIKWKEIKPSFYHRFKQGSINLFGWLMPDLSKLK